MIYSTFQDKELSLLGLGTMRLPLIPGGGEGDIDQERVNEMTDYALAHGINYFDTAVPYHASRSELAIGKALSRHPRESYYLADKYPGHQVMSVYDPESMFEDQLKKCGVDYFDFYLLHNVSEYSIPTYNNKDYGIVDYFIAQREAGRIRHLGFSCHADVEALRDWLDQYDGVFEFCQIQLNYLDWSLQRAKEKYELLTERGIPVWVMEPVRGGRLAKLDDDAEARLRVLRPEESTAAWAFRWLQGLPNVKMILSGMSDLDQMVDNVRTFEQRRPLNEEERGTVYAVAEKVKSAVPCTACRYCCAGCPKGLDIPLLIRQYNDYLIHPSINISMKLDSMGRDAMPDNCIGCGRCARTCPQKINVPEVMKKMVEGFKNLPDWAQLCREREAAAERGKMNAAT